jgi:dolichol-phosphate mannosyltransferase
MTPREGISVVIPFYNEEPNLEPLRTRLLPVLERMERPFEVILVDDGSDDDGPRIADAMAREDPHILILHLETRSGQSAALDAGFRAAKHGIVVTLDADLQNEPEDIPILVDALEGTANSTVAGGASTTATATGPADAACGYRARRHDNWVRRASSVIANRVRDRITGDHITDTGCSLKAYRTVYLRRLKMFTGMHRFLPTLLRMEGARVVEIPVRHHPRVAGKSKYGISNRMWSGLRDCFAVRWMRDRRIRYRIREDSQ